MTWVIVMAVCYVVFAAWFAWLLHLGFKRIKDDVGKSTIYPAMRFSSILLAFPVVFAAVSKSWPLLIALCGVASIIIAAIAFDQIEEDSRKRSKKKSSKKEALCFESHLRRFLYCCYRIDSLLVYVPYFGIVPKPRDTRGFFML
ncbi:hypothetical protein IKX64_01680 [Candidatus Saccharibacteria bacterium]|nr:hypothetical protein [Candidatus Saccharibacteria bacterium]